MRSIRSLKRERGAETNRAKTAVVPDPQQTTATSPAGSLGDWGYFCGEEVAAGGGQGGGGASARRPLRKKSRTITSEDEEATFLLPSSKPARYSSQPLTVTECLPHASAAAAPHAPCPRSSRSQVIVGSFMRREVSFTSLFDQLNRPKLKRSLSHQNLGALLLHHHSRKTQSVLTHQSHHRSGRRGGADGGGSSSSGTDGGGGSSGTDGRVEYGRWPMHIRHSSLSRSYNDLATLNL